jgi:hypothetical protein
MFWLDATRRKKKDLHVRAQPDLYRWSICRSLFVAVEECKMYLTVYLRYVAHDIYQVIRAMAMSHHYVIFDSIVNQPARSQPTFASLVHETPLRYRRIFNCFFFHIIIALSLVQFEANAK